MSECLVLEKIHKSFSSKIHVLKGVDLSLMKATSTAIIGSSGEGKSTLLHIAGGLEAPSSGQILFNNIPLDKQDLSTVRNRNIGFIFQDFHLLEDLTVLQNALMPAYIARKSIHKKSPSFIRSYALLQQVGLQERIHHPVKLLSGGEKQRVCIARALCNDPCFILADEPTGNLDSVTSTKIHTLLIDIVRQEKKTLLVATHNKELASFCDQIYTLQDGSLHCTKQKKDLQSHIHG